MADAVTKMKALTDAMEARLIRDRRSIHARPETGWLEMRTSAIIAKRLTELGYEVLTGSRAVKPEARMGVPEESALRRHAEEVLSQEGTPGEYLTDEMKAGLTGAVGILRCGEGPTVALRFDIDALGMVERGDEGHRPAREGFASRNPGMMHACGHDGHVAIGLGAAEVLMALRKELHGTLKLIFQPAEEGARGARAITAAGHLDGVDYFIGSHIAPTDSLDDGDVTCGTYVRALTHSYIVLSYDKSGLTVLNANYNTASLSSGHSHSSISLAERVSTVSSGRTSSERCRITAPTRPSPSEK